MSNQLSYFTLNREGGEAKFPILSPSDFEKLSKVLRRQRKVEKAINLEVAKISGEKALAELDAIDARRIRFADLVEWVNTPEGRFQFVLHSLRKDNPDASEADVDKAIHDDGELLKVAAGVSHLTLGGKSPLTGEGASPTATGDSTPA